MYSVIKSKWIMHVVEEKYAFVSMWRWILRIMTSFAAVQALLLTTSKLHVTAVRSSVIYDFTAS